MHMRDVHRQVSARRRRRLVLGLVWATTTLVPQAHALWSSTTGVSKPVTERLSVSNAVLPGGAWKTPQDGAAARSGGGSMATGGTGLADAKTAIRAPRVAILTATSPERVEFYHAATQSKQCYAARHGYTFILDTDKFEEVHKREPWYNVYWVKVLVLRKYLPLYDWVVYMDADVVVHNYSYKLEWFMEGALAGETPVDVVLTDHNVNINNGVVFLRNSPWSATFLDDWLEVGRRKPLGRWSWDDQGAFWSLMLRHAREATGVKGSLCDQDGTFDGGQRLEQCTQGVLSELGHPYQARRIPHFRIVSPLRYVGPESGRVVVGGFNQYRAEDLQRPETAIEKQMQHFFKSWSPEAWFQEGNFLIHVYHKWRLNIEVPDLSESCEAAMHADGLAPGALRAKAAQWEAKRRLREAVRVVAADAKGVSCTAACEAQRMVCDVQGLELVNDCAVIKEHLGCRGCTRDYGPTNPSDGPPLDLAAAVHGDECKLHGAPHTTSGIGFDCDARHPKTRRLCPCRKT